MATWRRVGQSSRRTFLAASALALALAAGGCGSRKTVKAKPSEPVESAAAQSAVAPSAQEQVAVGSAAPAPVRLYGTLSPEEFERCFAAPGVEHAPAPAAAAAPPAAAAAYTEAPVVAGAGWNVVIARRWRWIVIHHSATQTGSAASFHREHRERGWEGLGYHFVIGNGTGSGDGQVEVGYRWARQSRGAHAGELLYNEYGIGICLVGDFETAHPTSRQMASLTSLVRFLQGKCGIPLANIIGHDDVPGKKTRCPGKNFSVPLFRASLAGEVAAPPPRPRPAPLTASRPVPVRATARSSAAGCP
jgi:hypothetical protein